MRRIRRIIAGLVDQPDAATWLRVGEIVEAWSSRVEATPIADVVWIAATSDEHLADGLARDLSAAGAAFTRSLRTEYDASEVDGADFVGFTGIDLSMEPPFVLNEREAYRDEPPCPVCGHQDRFDEAVVAPPSVDETLLDLPAPDGTSPGRFGWEVVNLPGGQRLVSTRLAGELRAAGIRGLEYEEVRAADGSPSTRLIGLRASVAVLTPCPIHTTIEGDPYCPACGTAYGDLDGFFWIERSRIGDAEAVSRHPGRRAMLSLGRRPWSIIGRAAGARRGEPTMVCDD